MTSLIAVEAKRRNLDDDLLDPLRKRLAEEAAAPPTLLASALGPESQLYGAVFCAMPAMPVS